VRIAVIQHIPQALQHRVHLRLVVIHPTILGQEAEHVSRGSRTAFTR
jgi:hypothetical protein